MRKQATNKRYTPLSTMVFGSLCLLLVSFSYLDRKESPSSPLISTPLALLTESEVYQANPIKDDYWKFFTPSWRKDSLWPGLSSKDRTKEVWPDPMDLGFSDLEYLLDDPSNRLEPEFKIPIALRERVGFWLQVFGRFSSRTKIIHDKRKPEIIYGYLDFRSHFRDTSSVATAAYRSDRSERLVIKSLILRMREAAGLSKTHLLSEEEKKSLQELIERAGGGLDEKSVGRAIRNLRTQTGQNDYFLQGLQRARLMMPQIEAIFRERGLPVGLTRIPFVESSFNPKAYSKIGAIGLWQFVPETARQMIHDEHEFRWRDPIAQSKAAARLLQLYRKVLPDWGTTITAYNSGVGRMRRLVQKYALDSADDFDSIPIKEPFGFAGRNFFVEVLAVNLLEHYKEVLFESYVPPMEPFLVYKGPRSNKWNLDF